MFGNESQPSVIYRYGAKAPTLGAEVIGEQIWLAHRYGNALVEIERDRRDAVAAKIRELSPTLHGALAEYERFSAAVQETAAEVKRANVAARRRSGEPRPDKERLKTLRNAKREAAAAVKVAKQRAYGSEQAKVALATIDAEFLERVKRARAESGLYWGTYLRVEQAAQKHRKGPPPRFRRWQHDGAVAVQIQRGMTVNDAIAGDNRIRLEPAGKWWRLWLRVQSEGRHPVWAVIPVRIHRPIPEDARIKWVSIHRRRVGCTDQWSVCFVLARESGWAKADTAGDGAVGIDLGWRVVPAGIRVAYWCGSDGWRHDNLIISERDAARWTKADDLRSIRDQRFNAAKENLRMRLATMGGKPQWLIETTSHLNQWRSAARLAALAIRWRGERFEGDEVAFAELEAWRKQDRHLYEWEANQRRKAVAWRDDLYRRFAAELSRRYRTVVLEDADWRELARHAPEEEADSRIGQFARTIAAPGRLREILRERFAESLLVPAEYTTQQCHVCGGRCEWDQGRHLEHTCEHCGCRWDQDANAAANMVAAASGPVACETP